MPRGRDELKRAAAERWCGNATQLTGVRWGYLPITQPDVARLASKQFSDLLVLAP